MTRAELIESYVQEFRRHREVGDHEWVTYTRVDQDVARIVLEAATEAAQQADEGIWVDRVPDNYDAPVQTLPETAVIRFGNFPPLWVSQ